MTMNGLSNTPLLDFLTFLAASKCPKVEIPDTAVFLNKETTGLFKYSHADEHIVFDPSWPQHERRPARLFHIRKASEYTGKLNMVVSHFIRDQNNPAALHLCQTENGVQTTFLTQEMLWQNIGSISQTDGMLQLYDIPHDNHHNLVRVMYTPYMTRIEKHVCAHDLGDKSVPFTERVATSQSNANVVVADVSPQTERKIRRMCAALTESYHAQGLHLQLCVFYGIEVSSSRFLLLWCSNVDVRSWEEGREHSALEKMQASLRMGSGANMTARTDTVTPPPSPNLQPMEIEAELEEIYSNVSEFGYWGKKAPVPPHLARQVTQTVRVLLPAFKLPVMSDADFPDKYVIAAPGIPAHEGDDLAISEISSEMTGHQQGLPEYQASVVSQNSVRIANQLNITPSEVAERSLQMEAAYNTVLQRTGSMGTRSLTATPPKHPLLSTPSSFASGRGGRVSGEDGVGDFNSASPVPLLSANSLSLAAESLRATASRHLVDELTMDYVDGVLKELEVDHKNVGRIVTLRRKYAPHQMALQEGERAAGLQLAARKEQVHRQAQAMVDFVKGKTKTPPLGHRRAKSASLHRSRVSHERPWDPTLSSTKHDTSSSVARQRKASHPRPSELPSMSGATARNTTLGTSSKDDSRSPFGRSRLGGVTQKIPLTKHYEDLLVDGSLMNYQTETACLPPESTEPKYFQVEGRLPKMTTQDKVKVPDAPVMDLGNTHLSLSQEVLTKRKLSGIKCRNMLDLLFYPEQEKENEALLRLERERQELERMKADDERRRRDADERRRLQDEARMAAAEEQRMKQLLHSQYGAMDAKQKVHKVVTAVEDLIYHAYSEELGSPGRRSEELVVAVPRRQQDIAAEMRAVMLGLAFKEQFAPPNFPFDSDEDEMEERVDADRNRKVFVLPNDAVVVTRVRTQLQQYMSDVHRMYQEGEWTNLGRVKHLVDVSGYTFYDAVMAVKRSVARTRHSIAVATGPTSTTVLMSPRTQFGIPPELAGARELSTSQGSGRPSAGMM